jgi:hypothetical protein
MYHLFLCSFIQRSKRTEALAVEGLLAFTFCFYLNAGKTSTLYKVEAEKGREIFVAFHTSNVSDIKVLSSDGPLTVWLIN